MDEIVHDRISTRSEEWKSVCFYFSESSLPSWGKCELNFDVRGGISVILENTFSDSEIIYGELSVLARELRIDINILTTQIKVRDQINSAYQGIMLPLMLEDLRHLCGYVNAFFIQLASIHLGLNKLNCTVKNAHVVTTASLLPHGIPYKLLIELQLISDQHKTVKPQIL